MERSVRRPAVAGSFYPSDPMALERMVRAFLGQARSRPRPVKALIVPHAGYVYSGPVAAEGYRLLEPLRKTIRRVVLLGPAHFEPLRGLAAPSVTHFETPLGQIPLDAGAIERALTLAQVHTVDAPHAREHSLEVHLPFLQVVLDAFSLVPLAVGDASTREVAEVLALLWGASETLIVISSDLSHFHDYETARRRDRRTAAAIESRRYKKVGSKDACGCRAIGGLLYLARDRDMQVDIVDLRSSGDTAGPRGEVVGYGAFALGESPT